MEMPESDDIVDRAVVTVSNGAEEESLSGSGPDSIMFIIDRFLGLQEDAHLLLEGLGGSTLEMFTVGDTLRWKYIPPKPE